MAIEKATKDFQQTEVFTLAHPSIDPAQHDAFHANSIRVLK
ncbi:hypothetical protein MUGA111182_18205 [Mucilaginibacter galii]|nr:hypothetical protein [Mucilaginibacter galii]